MLQFFKHDFVRYWASFKLCVCPPQLWFLYGHNLSTEFEMKIEDLVLIGFE